MKTIEINIPQRLKDLRNQHGYSQEEVANYLGMAQSRYGHYEAGRATPSIETMVILCEYYSLSSIDELLGMAAQEKTFRRDRIIDAYHSVDPEKRKIVDFILNLNC